jgi:hypothetical protein
MSLTVLCITGWCRNGSTILGNILGEVPGFFHAGELHFLWKNATGHGANNRCGCGASLVDCPLWSEVLVAGLPPGVALTQAAEGVVARQRALVRTRYTWRLLRHGKAGVRTAAHADLLSRTFAAIAEQTGARVIVDTSKMPAESVLLPLLPDITTYFVHLVRHPAATAESWRLPKEYVPAMSAARSTAYWHGFNLAAYAIARRWPDRSSFLRYEDFIADPDATVDRLLRMVGADAAANPMHGRTVDLHTNHTVTGNPDRFRTGPTVIRDTDDAWRTRLPHRDRRIALALAWPLSWRYGYRPAPATPRPSPAIEEIDRGSRA